MQINQISNISNNYIVSDKINNFSFRANVPMKSDSFEKKSVQTTSNDSKTIMEKVAGGIAALGTFTGVGIAIKKGKFSFLKDLKPYKLKEVNTKWNPEHMWGRTTDEAERRHFIEMFVDPIKKGKNPDNGFLVQGPESKGKEEFFNWGIEQLRGAGVEIIDATDKELGHSTRKHIGKLWNLFQPEVAEDFKQNKKYKLYVMRKLEKIDPEHNHRRVSSGLKGDTAKSAEEYGVMLAYDCLDASNFDPAITRIERIDRLFSPQPKPDEDLNIWKKYIEHIKTHHTPLWLKKELDETREIMAQRDGNALKEMEPYLKYHPPYEMPKTKNSTKSWKKYFDASKRDLTEYQQYDEFTDAASILVHDYLYKYIPEKKYTKIMGMLKEHTPEQYKDSMDKWINIELNQRI